MRTNSINLTNLDTTTRKGNMIIAQMMSGNSIKTSELADKSLLIKGYLYYTQTETDDTTREVVDVKNILILQDVDGVITGTVSPTFIEKMLTFIETLGASEEEPLPIIPRYGQVKSKSGRDFLDVDLDI